MNLDDTAQMRSGLRKLAPASTVLGVSIGHVALGFGTARAYAHGIMAAATIVLPGTPNVFTEDR
nr:hypothetical protein [uncultured Novosphingobium sp.]